MSESASNANRSEFDKKAKRNRKEKEKAFERLISLPSEQHEARLAELAKRFDEDVAAVRDDFTAFAGMASRAAVLRRPMRRRMVLSEPAVGHSILTIVGASVRAYV